MSSMSFNQQQKQRQSLKQMQRLIMSPQMQQAIHLMQVPALELTVAIEQELEQNPVLEYLEDEGRGEEERESPEEEVEKELDFNEDDFEILRRLDEDFNDHFMQNEVPYKRTQEEEKLKTFLEQSIPVQESLFEHLLKEARETFATEEECSMAEGLIGNFDENGFLTTPIQEIALLNNFSEYRLREILLEIQKFDPAGVGAESLQESLLIQLRQLGLEGSLAYKIVQRHYDDLLHNRIPQIKRGLKCSAEEIKTAVENHISHLDLHPGKAYSHLDAQPIVPDLALIEEGGELIVAINDDYIPPLRLNRRYLKMLMDDTLSRETKDFIKNKVLSAKWLLKNIHQRNETIRRVAEAVAKKQREYLLNLEGALVPMTMKQIAEELEVHESTIARAVAHKYASTPRGILPLRFFFSNAYTTEEGEDISSKTVRNELKRIIDDENKKQPLSDEKLSRLLQRKGIPCARRTVAKYRSEMQIGTATQRREYE